jgi:predicted Ser/Thr protein kinase
MSALEEQTTTSDPRRVLRDRYELRDICGSGGMAQVHCGFDLLLGRKVAIKLLRNLSNDSLLQRFEREAHILSQLNHPNIASIYDLGVEGVQPFIVMEYVEGYSLYHLISDKVGLPMERALPLIFQIGEGLAAAHDLGVIHRDIKPENILVSLEGGEREVAHLIDFGLAVQDDPEKTADRLTLHGDILGTRRYMSPEQKLGKATTVASDVYAFGLVCAEILFGAQCVSEGRLELAPKTTPQTDLIWFVIATACEEDPARRWKDAGKMMEALHRATGASGIEKQRLRIKREYIHLLNCFIGRRKTERWLVFFALALLGVWSWNPDVDAWFVDREARVKLEGVSVAWLPKHELRVRVAGMASNFPTGLIVIEAMLHDRNGEPVPDPHSMVIDQVMMGRKSVLLSLPLQAIDRDFMFRPTWRVREGYVLVRLLDESRNVLMERRVHFQPPGVKRVPQSSLAKKRV